MGGTGWRALAVAGLAAALAAPAAAQTTPTRAQIEAAFASADRNGDGVVNVDEYVGHYVALFGSVDGNRDRMVSMADVPNADPAGFRAADRDGDGMVSLGEAIAERMILFFELDANEDGVLTLEEILSHESLAG